MHDSAKSSIDLPSKIDCINEGIDLPSAMESIDSNNGGIDMPAIIGKINSSMENIDGNEVELAAFLSSLREDIFYQLMELKFQQDFSETQITQVLQLLESVVSVILDRLFRDKAKSEAANSLLFSRINSSDKRGKLYKKHSPTCPIDIGSFSYLPVVPQIQYLLDKCSNEFRNKFRRENLLKKMDDCEILDSPFCGKYVRECISNVDSDVDLVVPLAMFFDEFCHLNPIGPVVQRNKLAVCLFKLVLEENWNDEGFLLAVAKSIDLDKLKTSDLNRVIYKLNDESSTPFVLHDGTKCQIAFVFLKADNLAQHQLAGLYQSFSACHSCLKCLASKHDLVHIFSEDDPRAKIRTVISTEKQILLIKSAHSALTAKQHAQAHGISGTASAILRIGLRHHFPYCVVPDISHDLLEGVCISEIESLIFFAKKEYKLTEEDLNHAITQFCKIADPLEKYGSLPVANFSFQPGRKLFSATFAQTKCLMSRMGLILSMTVSVGRKERFFETRQWKLFSQLAKIVAISFSNIIRRSEVEQLKHLVTLYLREKTAISDESLKPKQHNMIHYPSSILYYGPLKYLMTMSEERTLSSLSPMIHTNNRSVEQVINTCRFQIYFYVQKLSMKAVPAVGRFKTLENALPQSVINHFQLPPEKQVKIISSVRWKGMVLAPGLALLLSDPNGHWLSSTNPGKWCKILYVFLDNEKLYTVVQTIKRREYYKPLLAFEVELSEELNLVNCDNICVKKSFSIHNVNSKHFLFIDQLPYKLY